MNILITGGAGYIGSEMVGHFLNQGHKVHVVDNLLYGAESLLGYVSNKNFEFTKGDVRLASSVDPLLNWADVVIPLAALVGFPLCKRKPKEAGEINFLSNLWLAKNKSPNQLLIYPCTNSGYGTTENGSVCTEESPLNPVTLYGQTKVDAEKVYQETEGCSTVRLATVFGPSRRPRTDLLVNNFVFKAYKERVLVLYESKFMRNYIHIQDVIRAFDFLIKNWDKCCNETYNVGNDAINMNKMELAEKIQTHLPFEIIQAEFNSDPDVRDYIVSSQKLYDLGFACEYDLDVGIQQLIKGYRLIDSPWYANY